MKRFINFGSIEQYRNIVKTIQMTTQFVGIVDDKAVYDKTIKFPVIEVTASEKIHGTNAAFCYSNSTGYWVQSRKNIITPEKDNAGCAFQVAANLNKWEAIVKYLSRLYDIDLDKEIITVFFEWSGGNIQKLSACSGLDKRAIIFQHFKVSPIDENSETPAIWFETDRVTHSPDHNIFNIMNFGIYEFNVDFNNPLLSQNSFLEAVDFIEDESPLGKAMGIRRNVGEGIVCTFMYKDTLHRFKVKGEKHSKSKVKTLKLVDEVKENKKILFVNNHACKSWRLEQAWQEVFGINNEKQEPNIKYTGDFLRCVIKDVIKEESDILFDMELEPKEVNGMISKVARTWFMEQLDKFYVI